MHVVELLLQTFEGCENTPNDLGEERTKSNTPVPLECSCSTCISMVHTCLMPEAWPKHVDMSE